MKKTLRVLIAMAVVSTVLFGGLVGTVAAQDQENEFEQDAEAEVDQEQWVAQTNVNVQDDNYAISAWGDDATAVQASDQSNQNSQTGVAVASNSAEDVEQENENENGFYPVS